MAAQLFKDTEFFNEKIKKLNPDVDFEKLSSKSPEKIVWECEKGHNWHIRTKSVIVGKRGCPYCQNKKILAGFNDLATTHPKIAQEWDYEKNDITPQEISAGTNRKMWWICPQGHSYLKGVKYRKNGQNCIYCFGKKTLQGFNDIATTHPEIAQEWDYEKNGDLNPTTVSKGSERKAWWKCINNHSYSMRISIRASDGQGCPYCSGIKTLTGFNDFASVNPELLKYWDYEKNKDISPEEISYGSGKKAWWKCNQGHSYYSNIYDRSAGKLCRQCVHFISKQEANLVQWIEDTFPHLKVLSNTRKIISPKELDIYIPELSIAIEFNGIYWHSTAYKKDKNYHLNKLKSCKDKGIQLITIWEDDWLDSKKQTIVKSMLTHKFGMSDKRKIYARNTTVAEIDSSEARDFCNNYHIQGASSGSLYLGLKDNKTHELVAVSIWRKLGDKFYLDRYCTSAHIIGGLGKLLKIAKVQARDVYNCLHIVTFSDNEISDGGMYEKLGFIKDKELKPDYKYLHNNKRVHKFNFRKSRFKKDPELKYQENLTESQLAQLNNLHKIYDCGKTRWVFVL